MGGGIVGENGARAWGCSRVSLAERLSPHARHEAAGRRPQRVVQYVRAVLGPPACSTVASGLQGDHEHMNVCLKSADFPQFCGKVRTFHWSFEKGNAEKNELKTVALFPRAVVRLFSAGSDRSTAAVPSLSPPRPSASSPIEPQVFNALFRKWPPTT